MLAGPADGWEEEGQECGIKDASEFSSELGGGWTVEPLTELVGYWLSSWTT